MTAQEFMLAVQAIALLRWPPVHHDHANLPNDGEGFEDG